MFPRTLGNLITLSLAQNKIEDIYKQAFPFPRLQFLWVELLSFVT